MSSLSKSNLRKQLSNSFPLSINQNWLKTMSRSVTTTLTPEQQRLVSKTKNEFGITDAEEVTMRHLELTAKEDCKRIAEITRLDSESPHLYLCKVLGISHNATREIAEKALELRRARLQNAEPDPTIEGIVSEMLKTASAELDRIYFLSEESKLGTKAAAAVEKTTHPTLPQNTTILEAWNASQAHKRQFGDVLPDLEASLQKRNAATQGQRDTFDSGSIKPETLEEASIRRSKASERRIDVIQADAGDYFLKQKEASRGERPVPTPEQRLAESTKKIRTMRGRELEENDTDTMFANLKKRRQETRKEYEELRGMTKEEFEDFEYKEKQSAILEDKKRREETAPMREEIHRRNQAITRALKAAQFPEGTTAAERLEAFHKAEAARSKAPSSSPKHTDPTAIPVTPGRPSSRGGK
jgi:hypothetical protein